MRLIDADAVYETACKNCIYHGEMQGQCSNVEPCGELIWAFASASTIDPESLRPKGEWEVDKFGIWRCPNCRHSIYDEEHLSSFCPNCGADMRGEATPNV